MGKLPPASSVPFAVFQSELMWLDKDDLENIAAEYKTAENTIMEKVSHALLPPASTVHLEEIADATYFTNGGNQSYTPLYKLPFEVAHFVSPIYCCTPLTHTVIRWRGRARFSRNACRSEKPATVWIIDRRR